MLAPVAVPTLVTIELRFTTTEDAEGLTERVGEAVRMIVGRDALEEFRWRSIPLEPPRDRIRPR